MQASEKQLSELAKFLFAVLCLVKALLSSTRAHELILVNLSTR